MTDDGLYHYKYDAWNRLVEVRRKSGTGADRDHDLVGWYTYDGLGRRISKQVANSGSRNATQYMYYNYKWQLLEIRNDQDKPRQQFVWGTQYIDEAICMDVDTDSNGVCTDFGTSGARRFFYCQDANYNVIALREGSTIVERYEYDPYGTCRILKGYDSTIYAESLNVTGQSLRWMDPSLPENPIRYGGYFYDTETDLNQAGYRSYNPRLGAWVRRDPLGIATGFGGAKIPLTGQYAGGMNLYGYVEGNPITGVDPWGLCASGTCNSGPHYVPIPNGCGAEGGTKWPDGSPYWSFKDACDNHDICYGSCGSSKDACDNSLLNDAEKACYDFWNTLGWNKYNPAGWAAFLACVAQAHAYYEAVHLAGGSAFKNAQDEACGCNSSSPPSPLNPSPCMPIGDGLYYCPDMPLVR